MKICTHVNFRRSLHPCFTLTLQKMYITYHRVVVFSLTIFCLFVNFRFNLLYIWVILVSFLSFIVAAIKRNPILPRNPANIHICCFGDHVHIAQVGPCSIRNQQRINIIRRFYSYLTFLERWCYRHINHSLLWRPCTNCSYIHFLLIWEQFCNFNDWIIDLNVFFYLVHIFCFDYLYFPVHSIYFFLSMHKINRKITKQLKWYSNMDEWWI